MNEADDRIKTTEVDEPTKKESLRGGKSNAKAVEVYDLEGVFIATYASGSLAAQALNVQQSDISLCCRNLKQSVNGYKFKFVAEYIDEESANLKLKRGYALEVVSNDFNRSEVSTRSTRTSRGDYGVTFTEPQFNISLTGIKTRKWQSKYVKFGSLILKKWCPDSEMPTFELQQYLKTDKKKLSLRRQSTKK